MLVASNCMTQSTICSSVLGPASVPSLLMWPMRITGIPLVLANLSSAEAHSLICDTLPGLESTSSVEMVCIESMTTNCGCASRMQAKMLSSEVSQRIVTWPISLAPLSMRSARILIWCGLSSPDTYITSTPCILRMVCSVRVDLPMPGSPPMSTRLPGTSPPPNTRLSSASRVSILGSSCAEISLSGIGRASPWCRLRWALRVWAAALAAIVPLSAAILISLNVFHRPQLGHLPIHLGDSCPHSEHTYAILSFAISV